MILRPSKVGRTFCDRMSRPLIRISKHYPSLYENLREDGMISNNLDTVLAAFPSKIPANSRLFHTLNDTFLYDFGSKKFHFLAVTEQGAERVSLFDIMSDARDHMRNSRPYTGA